jgi:predicted Fe-Mo cluster-binding NifX family protein
LITGNGPGSNTSAVLEKINIKIFIGATNMSAQEALEHYKKGWLKEE